VVLYVHADGQGPHLEVSPAAERMLLSTRTTGGVPRRRPSRRPHAGRRPVAGRPSRCATAADPVFYERLHGIAGAHGRGLGALPVAPSAEHRVLVQVAETMNRRNRLAWEILASVVVPQLLLILMATVACTSACRAACGPCEASWRAVSDRSHLDLSPIDVSSVPAEVRPLVEEVNDLMQRLGKTLDFQSRFMADAAHQLKTPWRAEGADRAGAARESDPQRLRTRWPSCTSAPTGCRAWCSSCCRWPATSPAPPKPCTCEPVDLQALALEAAAWSGCRWRSSAASTWASKAPGSRC
jgi:two-component system sensor histidine kinase TctE